MSQTTDHIESGKLFMKDAFQRWYRVPEYQRPYVWESDQVNDLLGDVCYALDTRPDAEYFLGSLVLQKHHANAEGQEFEEHDLLDGQQRLTTCLLLHAVARDLSHDPNLKDTCRTTLFQRENRYNATPERLRIVFEIRDSVSQFFNTFLKEDGGTNNEEALVAQKNAPDVSVRNMAAAVLEIRRYFQQSQAPSIEDFVQFFRNNVLLIYVASTQLEDAFRLFTVLNNRGIKLRNSDILKTMNLGALRAEGAPDYEQRQAALTWEKIEGALGDDFDTFLAHLRTILVKEKARLNLVEEFEKNVYQPKEFIKETKQYNPLPPRLRQGRATFNFVSRHWSHYQQIFGGANHHLSGSWEFDNLITLLHESGLADFWVPPVLHYFEKFSEEHITEFLALLENKFCGDWVLQQTPTTRIENMNAVIKKIDEVTSTTQPRQAQLSSLFTSSVFSFDVPKFINHLEMESIYGRRFARYILYKLDMVYGGKGNRLQPPKEVSVEHILPQSPDKNSLWCKNFSDADRLTWTDRLGNLVLISGRKNSAQGRLDFADKKTAYFQRNIETFPNSLRVLQNNEHWTVTELCNNHKSVLDKLRDYIAECQKRTISTKAAEA